MVKDLPANSGDVGSIPGWERFPGVGSGNPLQYSFLEKSMDRGNWRTIVHGVTKAACMQSSSQGIKTCFTQSPFFG